MRIRHFNENGDYYGAAGEDHRLPRGGDGTADRLLHRQALGQELSVASHEEERIVDADTETNHACDLRSPAWNLDEVGDQRHRTHAEREAEKGHADREAHGNDRAERQEENDNGNDDAQQLADPGLGFLEGEEQVAVGLGLQHLVVGGVDGPLEFLEVLRAELLDYWVLQSNQRDPAVDRDRPGLRSPFRAERQRSRWIRGAEHVW